MVSWHARAKARPGLASVQTKEAAIDGVITDGSGYCLKITTQTLSCATDRHRRGWPSSWGNLCHQYRIDKVIADTYYDHRDNNDQGVRLRPVPIHTCILCDMRSNLGT